MLLLPAAGRFNHRFNYRFSPVQRSRQGVTLVEVVLIISVIFLNAAIFLPFVRQSREVSRQNQCRNNFRAIGIGLHQYHDVHQSLPSGFEVSATGAYLGWGWQLRILPYLNVGNLHDRIEPRLAEGIGVLPNVPELQQHLPSLRCPSDPASEMVAHSSVVTEAVVDGIVTGAGVNWQNRLPRSSYFGNVGYLQVEVGGIQYNAVGTPTSTVPSVNQGSLGCTGPVRSSEHRYCDQEHFGGFFGQNSHIRFRDVADGTSNTIMVGERYSPADFSPGAVGHGSWIGVPDCTEAQGLAVALADASVRINIGLPYREQTTGFGSWHGDGALFLFGDGSTRFLSQRIEMARFRNMSTINDGKKLPEAIR